MNASSSGHWIYCSHAFLHSEILHHKGRALVWQRYQRFWEYSRLFMKPYQDLATFLCLSYRVQGSYGSDCRSNHGVSVWEYVQLHQIIAEHPTVYWKTNCSSIKDLTVSLSPLQPMPPRPPPPCAGWQCWSAGVSLPLFSFFPCWSSFTSTTFSTTQ